MPLRVLDRVCDPDSPSNADGWSASPEVALLLDGAAPVSPERVSAYPNDSVWLVRRYPECFREELARAPVPRDIAEIAERSRLALQAEYRELCRRAGATPGETPFACLAIAQDDGARIELLSMGDQTSLVRGARGLIGKLGESAVRELDRRALEALERERAAGVEPHAARHARVRPLILANRAQRNHLAGYDVLDVEISCRDRFERFCSERGEVRDLLLMSDGFYRLVDTFGRYDDATLFDAVERSGLGALLAELRALEHEDPECTRHARFKRHDDATALWIAVDPA